MTNKPLVALGVLLLVIGLAIIVGLLSQGVAPEPEMQAGVQPEEGAVAIVPSFVWPILAGISLAAGAACIMLGMNRWKQRT